MKVLVLMGAEGSGLTPGVQQPMLHFGVAELSDAAAANLRVTASVVLNDASDARQLQALLVPGSLLPKDPA